MRITLTNLNPNLPYLVRARSKIGSSYSDWSRNYPFIATGDSIAPKKPTNVVGSMSGTSFKLSWDAVTQSTDNTPVNDLDHYDVLVSSAGTITTGVYKTTDTKFELSYEMNGSLFGSTRGNIQMAVRAVDAVNNTDGYSATISQTNPVPANVTALTGVSGVNLLTFKWDAPADQDLKQYRIYSGTVAGTQATLVWTGTALNASIQTADTVTDKWYRVVAVDVFDGESTGTITGPLKPLSPTTVDTVAPAIPTGLAATLTNSIDGKSASAAVSWTAVADSDLDSYVVGFRQVASPVNDWQYATVDRYTTTTTIQGLVPYKNYDFKIRAKDYSANYSSYSTMVTAVAVVNTAPAIPTGLSVTAGNDNLQISWAENSEVDMANNAGTYDVTVATNSAFTTGVLQYRTGATTLSVNGIATSTAYWVRVRATDSGGMSSAYSSSVTKTTNSFPVTSLSDGAVPVGAVTLTATGGIGYIYLNWTTLSNPDPIIYDVYMSTASGFTTYNSTTKITEVSGTSAFIDTVVGGASLAYGTTYYFKVIARDRDGASTTASNQASAIPLRVGAIDSALTAADVGAPTNTQFNNLNTTVGGSLKTYSAEYSVNGSETVAPTTGWSTATPTRTPGTFVWYRVTVTYNDNTTATTSAALLTGNAGATGTTGSTGTAGTNGISVSSITPYFNQTTAGSAAPAVPTASPPPAPWTATEPNYVANTDLWTVQRIIFSNATFAYTTVNKSSSYAAAVTAQATADGKNKIIRSTGDATGTTGYVNGDLWWKIDGSGNVIQQWKYSGSAWVSEVLLDGVLGSLNANKITSGYLDVANRVAAGSITTKLLTVGDTANVAELNESQAGLVTYDGWTSTIENVSGVTWSNRSVRTSQYFMFRNIKGPIPFVAGDKVKVQFEAFSDVAVPLQLDFYLYGTVSLYPNCAPIAGSPTIISTTPQTFTTIATIPATTDQSVFLLGLAGLTNKNVRVRNVRAYIMNAGQLVVDGSVSASVISSGSSFTTNLFIGTGGAIQSSNYTSGTTGFKLTNQGLIIEGSGNSVSASVIGGGTITGSVINVGTGGVLNIDSTAVLKSNNYAAGSTGYRLNSSGLEINDGSIDAKALKTNTAVIGDLIIGRTADNLGSIKSFNYVGSSTGYKMDKSGLEINNGTIAAAALRIQSGSNMIAPQYASFEFVPTFYNLALSSSGATAIIKTAGGKFSNQYLEMRSTVAAASWCYLGASATDYNIPMEAGTYIISAWVRGGSVASTMTLRLKGSNGTFYAGTPSLIAASSAWQRISSSIIIPSGVTSSVMAIWCDSTTLNAGVDIDGVQVEQQLTPLATPSAWTPSGMTSADGAVLRTGEIRSNTNVTVNGVSQPAWSINMAGGAQFGNAAIRGSLIVGAVGGDVDAGQSFISSANYASGTAGWKIDSAGNLEANSGSIRGDMLVRGSVSAASLSIGVRGSNLVPDPSFEDLQPSVSPTAIPSVISDSGWWTDSIANGSQTPELRRLRARSGAWSVRTSTVGTGGETTVRSGVVAVEPGQTYKFSYYAVGSTSTVRILSEIYGGATTSSITALQTITADAETEPLPLYTSVEPYDPNLYTAYNYDYTVPAGINFIRIRLGTPTTSGSGSISFDDVAIILKGTPSTEVTAAGIRIFDSEGLESGAFVSNRPNYISVSSGGANVASIDTSGNISGLSGAFRGDQETANSLGDVPNALSFGGTDLADRLWAMPQGIVAQVLKTNVTINKIRNEYGICELSWTALPGRHYRLAFWGARLRSPTATGGATIRIRRLQNGATPTITSPVTREYDMILSNAVDGVSIPYIQAPGLYVADNGSPTLVRAILTIALWNDPVSTASLDLTTNSFSPLEGIVEDLGPDVPDTWLANSGGGALYTGGTDTGGGSAPVSAKKTYTTSWIANSSQCRRGISIYGNYTVNTAAETGYMLAGYYSSSNGNQFSYYQFTGSNSTGGQSGISISSAISGATISKVEMYVQNATFYGSAGGSQRFGMTTLGSMPSGASASSTQSNGYTPNIGFSPGQGKWVTLTSAAISALTSGGRVAIIGQGSSNGQGYYSKWYDHIGSGAAQLRITYTK